MMNSGYNNTLTSSTPRVEKIRSGNSVRSQNIQEQPQDPQPSVIQHVQRLPPFSDLISGMTAPSVDTAYYSMNPGCSMSSLGLSRLYSTDTKDSTHETMLWNHGRHVPLSYSPATTFTYQSDWQDPNAQSVPSQAPASAPTQSTADQSDISFNFRDSSRILGASQDESLAGSLSMGSSPSPTPPSSPRQQLSYPSSPVEHSQTSTSGIAFESGVGYIWAESLSPASYGKKGAFSSTRKTASMPRRARHTAKEQLIGRLGNPSHSSASAVQRRHDYKLEASASKDLLAGDNDPQFYIGGTSTGPILGPTKPDQDPGQREWAPRRCPGKCGIDIVWKRRMDYFRHVCTTDVHTGDRKKVGWEEWFEIPETYAGKLQHCHYIGCKYAAGKGMRTDDLKKHMLAKHNAVPIE